MGFSVWGLGIRLWGLGIRLWGLGFRVWGLGFRIFIPAWLEMYGQCLALTMKIHVCGTHFEQLPGFVQGAEVILLNLSPTCPYTQNMYIHIHLNPVKPCVI